MPYKHKDLCLGPRTHVHIPVIPVLGNGDKRIPTGCWSASPDFLVNSRIMRDPVKKKKKWAATKELSSGYRWFSL